MREKIGRLTKKNKTNKKLITKKCQKSGEREGGWKAKRQRIDKGAMESSNPFSLFTSLKKRKGNEG